MSETTKAPALLSDERLAEYAEWVKLPVVAIQGNPYYANFAIRDLLTHVAAQQATFDARDAELCATFDAYRTQVAEVLRGLLLPEPSEAQIWDSSPAAAAKAWAAKEANQRLHAAAKALNLSL